jgi:hypothetical protein
VEDDGVAVCTAHQVEVDKDLKGAAEERVFAYCWKSVLEGWLIGLWLDVYGLADGLKTPMMQEEMDGRSGRSGHHGRRDGCESGFNQTCLI